MKRENGNTLFLILAAIVLFATLSYVITQNNRTGASTTAKEKQQLDQAELDNYAAALNLGMLRLQSINNCVTIDFTPPASWGAGNKSCHMFHPDGGQVSYRDFGTTCPSETILTNLSSIGGKCGNIVYAGISGGNRIYTTTADLGMFSWNNGTSSWVVTNVNSTSDGKANTTTLVNLLNVGAPYKAANACRALGADWYLPAYDELYLLYTHRVAIGGFNLSGANYAGYYWSSTEGATYADSGARVLRFNPGTWNNLTKGTPMSVRCVRR